MFIVLEGVDGSGKSTQIANLRAMLSEQGIATEYLHFPRFDAPYFGDLIARFLRGELGSVEQVDPYIVAMLYAGDRRDAAQMIRGWIDEGKVVESARVIEDLGADSANLMMLIMDLETEFNLTVEDEALGTIKTVGDIVDYIQKKV